MHEQVEEPESDNSRAVIFVRLEQRRKRKFEKDCISRNLWMISKAAAFSKGQALVENIAWIFSGNIV